VAPQFIYTMRGLSRFYPPDREVLKGINLSFYPGAKIGVIGSNGSGKSSLLRIMAGEDDGFSGEARLTPGFTVGYLAQEPQLNESKDVAGNVAEGVGESKQLVDRYNEVCAAFGDPDADIDALLAEQADLQAKIDAAGAWELDRTFEIAMDALRLPPGMPRSARCRAVNDGGWHCAGCSCPSPTCSSWTSRPTISMPSPWPGWSGRCRSTPAPSSP
jgi:sulfate-transporting ATPase